MFARSSEPWGQIGRLALIDAPVEVHACQRNRSLRSAHEMIGSMAWHSVQGSLFIDGLPGSGSTAAAEIGRRCPDSRVVLEMHPNHHLQRRPVRLSEAANTAQGPSAAATVTSATAATISRSCNRHPVG